MDDTENETTSFQALFVHDRLIIHLLEEKAHRKLADDLTRTSATLPDPAAFAYTFERAMPLIFESVPELSAMYVRGESLQGRLVTMTQDFYFKDLGSKRRQMQGRLDVNKDVLLRGEFSIDRTIGSTGETTLSGHERICVLARVVSSTESEIRIQPLFMGFRYIDTRAPVIEESFDRGLEVYAEEVDEFAKVQETERPTDKDLKIMGLIPEATVKRSFATIVGEPFVAKDWGGERSDLYTSRITIAGSRTTAAFAFKGPAVKGALTIAKMGKNGDQAIRLAEEPAELMVVQHHGYVVQPVRRLMQALARERAKKFMVLDGADTTRILRAYQQWPSQ